MWKNVLHYSNISGLLWTLCICLFHEGIPRWGQYGGIYLFVITWLIEIIVEKRWTSVKPNPEWWHYGMLIALFCLGFLYWPWDGTVYFHHHTEQRFPLFAFGLMGIFGINNRYSRATLVNTMVITAVGSILFLFFKTGWHNVFFSPDRVFLVSENRIRFVNSHMVYNFYLNSTLIGMWYLLFHADRKPSLYIKILYPIAAVLIFCMLLLSDGRSGFFMGLIILGMMIVIELHRFNKWLSVCISFLAIGFLFLFCSMHPRISKQTLTYDLRYAYWKSAVELIREKPILGYGISHAQEEFDQVNLKYATEEERYFWSVINHHYIDSHNQFIQSILEFGILGLLVTIAIYLSPLWICWGKREWWLAFFFTLISVGQSLFDIFITGQFNILYGILLLMTIKMKADYASPASLSV